MESINWNKVESNWNKVKGEAKQMWGKISDDALTQLDGKRDKLVAKLQEAYGYSTEKANQEIERFQNKVSSLVH